MCQNIAAQGSDQQLAEHYFSSGEFDKALVYYKRLSEKHQNKFYFDRYITCLDETGDIKEAEKLLKRAISKSPNSLDYSIQLATFYQKHNNENKASKK